MLSKSEFFTLVKRLLKGYVSNHGKIQISHEQEAESALTKALCGESLHTIRYGVLFSADVSTSATRHQR